MQSLFLEHMLAIHGCLTQVFVSYIHLIRFVGFLSYPADTSGILQILIHEAIILKGKEVRRLICPGIQELAAPFCLLS